MIAMGTRGMGSVRNMVLGSVAAKVIHLAEVPVLADQVRREARPAAAWSRSWINSVEATAAIARLRGASSGMTRANSVAHQQGVSCP